MITDNCIEKVEINGKQICVVDHGIDDKYDNVYCFDEKNALIWRIKQAPIEIGGTEKSPY